jgi:hypothetical protein
MVFLCGVSSMRSVLIVLFVSLLIFATCGSAQDAIPPGTILPVQLNSSINSRKLKPGQVIAARVMQDVPLSPHSKIPARAKVIGHVEANDGRQVSIRFDTLVASKRRISVTTNLRALASMMAVEQAQIPNTGPDRGTSEAEWATDHVGGQSINPLMLLRPTHKPGTQCRGEVAGTDRPQALWVFSSDACGAYGFPDLAIAHAGRTDPMGQITLTSKRGNVNVRAGSGMLLRVD